MALAASLLAGQQAAPVERQRQGPMLLRPSGREPLVDRSVQSHLDAGLYQFCLDRDDPFVTSILLQNQDGDVVLRAGDDSLCRSVELTAGTYTLTTKTRLGPGAERRTVFAGEVPVRAPLLGPNNTPVGGWWALRPASFLDPQRRAGRLRALNQVLAADYAFQIQDEWGIFNFSDPTAVVPYPPATGYLGADPATKGLVLLPQKPNAPVVIQDLGNYQFYLGTGTSPVFYAPKTDQNGVMMPVASPLPSSQISVVFRFFPDATQVGTLSSGEVALYSQCGYQGRAIVLAGSVPDLVAISAGETALDGGFLSARFGDNVGVAFHNAVGYGGQRTVYTSDQSCFPTSQHPHSILVRPLQTLILVSSRSCVNCKLSDADLTGLDLSGYDLTGATLTNANLTRTNLHGAILTNATIAGATLNCTDFSGTDDQHRVDLRGAVFATIADDASCRTNFQWTHLAGNSVLGSDWRHVDLRNVRIEGLANYPLSSKQNPLDLTGALLAGASLEGAILDYATGLAGADLTRINLNYASLQFADLSGAKLYGARLTNANLQGVRMPGAFLNSNPPAVTDAASLSGAWMKDADLTKATLSGADFTNASFYGTATAAGATMNNTQFANAYLAFADFSNTTVQAVQFGNAVLIGAKFTGASLSTDTSIGNNSGFTAAFLQGTDLSQASLEGTSFQNAFVDFTSGGNSLVMILDGSHTTFPGWADAGKDLCILVIYPQPSAVRDNSTIACPDGSSGPCGPASPDGSNTLWKSRIDLSARASYLSDSTYVPAAPPVCSNLNTDW